MKEKILQRGAEAVLIKRGDVVAKQRIKKSYRFTELDEKLRKLRTRSESKLLEKASKLIPTPKILKVDEKNKEIDVEFIEGLRLSDNLDDLKNWKEICRNIGENIAKLHDAGIIHGDLTTSNMIYVKKRKDNQNKKNSPNSLGNYNNKYENRQIKALGEIINKDNLNDNEVNGKVYFIDFGLGFHSNRIEDKAVDLHLIRQALEAKHFSKWEKFFGAVLDGYKISKNFKEVTRRFEKVEKRGRYKERY